MNKLTLSLVVACAALFFIIASVSAKPDTIVFKINNTTTESLGSVRIDLPYGQYQYMTVSGQGEFTTEIPADALSITINGQTVVSMVTGVVSLPNTHLVRGVWPSGRIVIVDQNEL